jgi:hypothetical protein
VLLCLLQRPEVILVHSNPLNPRCVLSRSKERRPIPPAHSDYSSSRPKPFLMQLGLLQTLVWVTPNDPPTFSSIGEKNFFWPKNREGYSLPFFSKIDENLNFLKNTGNVLWCLLQRPEVILVHSNPLNPRCVLSRSKERRPIPPAHSDYSSSHPKPFLMQLGCFRPSSG